MVRASGRLVVGILVLGGCVAAPEAQRSGGHPCRTEGECNRGMLCGPIHLCVEGYCADDTILRVCADGSYPEAGSPVGQCLTYLNCNAVACGPLVPCLNNRCAQDAPALVIPCLDAGPPDDGGALPDGDVSPPDDAGFTFDF